MMTSDKDKPKKQNSEVQKTQPTKDSIKKDTPEDNEKFSPGEPDDYNPEEFATD